MVLGHKQEQNQRFEHENAQKQREEGAPADGSTSLARKLRLKVLVFERGLDEPGSAMPRSARLLPGSGFVQRGAGNAPPGPAVISAAPGYPRLRSPLTRHASGPVNEPCDTFRRTNNLGARDVPSTGRRGQARQLCPALARRRARYDILPPVLREA